MLHTKTKHVAIKLTQRGEEVKMKYVNSKEKIVDIFTKPLPQDAHEYLRGILGVIPLSKAI